MKFLIIKRAALGDVLRTTALLPALHRRYGPAIEIDWLTDQCATPLLIGNPRISSILTVTPARQYDTVINLEEDLESARMATAACATPEGLRGFGHCAETVVPAEGCERWFAMSRLGGSDRDLLKRANRRTHPQILREIARLPQDEPPDPPEIHLTTTERIEGAIWRQQSVPTGLPLLGVATWAGGRWSKKSIGVNKLVAILAAVRRRGKSTICVLPGPGDVEPAAIVARALGCVLSTPTSVRAFAGRISQCSTILCADSLPLHIANALQIPKVVLVGPTSSAELELYGRGTTIQSEMSCLGCYLPTCNIAPDCMESLDEEAVAAALGDWSESTFASQTGVTSWS